LRALIRTIAIFYSLYAGAVQIDAISRVAGQGEDLFGYEKI